jgi:hypothetical protein
MAMWHEAKFVCLKIMGLRLKMLIQHNGEKTALSRSQHATAQAHSGHTRAGVANASLPRCVVSCGRGQCSYPPYRRTGG